MSTIKRILLAYLLLALTVSAITIIQPLASSGCETRNNVCQKVGNNCKATCTDQTADGTCQCVDGGQ